MGPINCGLIWLRARLGAGTYVQSLTGGTLHYEDLMIYDQCRDAIRTDGRARRTSNPPGVIRHKQLNKHLRG
jgi:hypothetical protein